MQYLQVLLSRAHVVNIICLVSKEIPDLGFKSQI